MYCPYCNSQTRDGSVFCSQCGSKVDLTVKTPKVSVSDIIKKNKTAIAIICVIALSVVLITVAVRAGSSSKSVIGTWRSSSGKEISFSSNGSFEDFRGYGRYTIYDGKKLSLVYEDWDWLGTNFTYEYGDDWYIKGNSLYLDGVYYTKK